MATVSAGLGFVLADFSAENVSGVSSGVLSQDPDFVWKKSWCAAPGRERGALQSAPEHDAKNQSAAFGRVPHRARLATDVHPGKEAAPPSVALAAKIFAERVERGWAGWARSAALPQHFFTATVLHQRTVSECCPPVSARGAVTAAYSRGIAPENADSAQTAGIRSIRRARRMHSKPLKKHALTGLFLVEFVGNRVSTSPKRLNLQRLESAF